jgi:hypothetical protein
VPVRLADQTSDVYGLDNTARECPRCETRRRRFEAPTGGPTVWYDTLMRDWVVRLPVVRLRMDAILPLGLWWFDTPWVEVYRAASDLAFVGEAFELRDAEAAEEAEEF